MTNAERLAQHLRFGRCSPSNADLLVEAEHMIASRPPTMSETDFVANWIAFAAFLASPEAARAAERAKPTTAAPKPLAFSGPVTPEIQRLVSAMREADVQGDDDDLKCEAARLLDSRHACHSVSEFVEMQVRNLKSKIWREKCYRNT